MAKITTRVFGERLRAGEGLREIGLGRVLPLDPPAESIDDGLLVCGSHSVALPHFFGGQGFYGDPILGEIIRPASEIQTEPGTRRPPQPAGSRCPGASVRPA